MHVLYTHVHPADPCMYTHRCFHPEISSDDSWLQLFLNEVRSCEAPVRLMKPGWAHVMQGLAHVKQGWLM